MDAATIHYKKNLAKRKFGNSRYNQIMRVSEDLETPPNDQLKAVANEMEMEDELQEALLEGRNIKYEEHTRDRAVIPHATDVPNFDEVDLSEVY